MKRKPNYLSDLIRQHVTNTIPQLKRSGDGSGIAATLAEAERIAWTFSQRRESIEADGRLTTEGKFDAVRASGRETLAVLERWYKPLRDGLDAHETQLKAQLHAAVTPSPPKDPGAVLEAALLRAEIRRGAMEMTGPQVELLYLQGDATVRKALEEVQSITVKNGAVMLRPFVSAELVAKCLQDAGREKLPEVAEQIEDINEVRSVYQVVAAAIEQEVRRAAPNAFEPAKPQVA